MAYCTDVHTQKDSCLLQRHGYAGHHANLNTLYTKRQMFYDRMSVYNLNKSNSLEQTVGHWLPKREQEQGGQIIQFNCKINPLSLWYMINARINNTAVFSRKLERREIKDPYHTKSIWTIYTKWKHFLEPPKYRVWRIMSDFLWILRLPLNYPQLVNQHRLTLLNSFPVRSSIQRFWHKIVKC